MDGGEEAGAQVVVQVLVLAHLENLLPLLLRHLALDAFGRLLLVAQLLPSELQQEETGSSRTPLGWGRGGASAGSSVSYPWVGRGHVARQEGQSVGQLSHSQSFQSSQALGLEALRSAGNTSAGL